MIVSILNPNCKPNHYCLSILNSELTMQFSNLHHFIKIDREILAFNLYIIQNQSKVLFNLKYYGNDVAYNIKRHLTPIIKIIK